jgi:hypothetical protein
MKVATFLFAIYGSVSVRFVTPTNSNENKERQILGAEATRTLSYSIKKTPSVSHIEVINTVTQTKVQNLNNGCQIDICKLQDQGIYTASQLNFRAVTSFTESVKFGWDSNSNYQLDNNAQYSLCGDDYGYYFPCDKLQPGYHCLTATPYSTINAQGAKGTTVTSCFNIIDCPRSVHPPVVAPVRAPIVSPKKPSLSAKPKTAPTATTPIYGPKNTKPTGAPRTLIPTDVPISLVPTRAPRTTKPSKAPQTEIPTHAPRTVRPTRAPRTVKPTRAPKTLKPTRAPQTIKPTRAPQTISPTHAPQTVKPTKAPLTVPPTHAPQTTKPTRAPTTMKPTRNPRTVKPTKAPTTLRPTRPKKAPVQSPVDIPSYDYY